MSQPQWDWGHGQTRGLLSSGISTWPVDQQSKTFAKLVRIQAEGIRRDPKGSEGIWRDPVTCSDGQTVSAKRGETDGNWWKLYELCVKVRSGFNAGHSTAIYLNANPEAQASAASNSNWCGLCLELFGDVWSGGAPFFPPPEALSDLKAENIGSGKGRPPSLLFLHVSPDLKTVLHQAKVFSFDIGQFPYTRGNSKLMKAHLQCTFPCVVSIGFCRGSVVWRLCSSPHANLASMCSLSVALSGPLWVHLRTVGRDCQSLWSRKAGLCHNVATAQHATMQHVLWPCFALCQARCEMRRD